MATIVNPNPVTPQTFGGMWVQNLQIAFPQEGKPAGLLNARMLPYDGTNLLALGGKQVMRRIDGALDGQTQAVLATITTEVKRLAANDTQPLSVIVGAQDPTKPVRIVVWFADKKTYHIPDAFALAGTDSTFAQVFGATLAEIARLAGLPFQP